MQPDVAGGMKDRVRRLQSGLRERLPTNRGRDRPVALECALEDAVTKAKTLLIVAAAFAATVVSGGCRASVDAIEDVPAGSDVVIGTEDGAVVEGALREVTGDRVIVEGFQKIKPGAEVAPAEWKTAARESEGTATR